MSQATDLAGLRYLPKEQPLSLAGPHHSDDRAGPRSSREPSGPSAWSVAESQPQTYFLGSPSRRHLIVTLIAGRDSLPRAQPLQPVPSLPSMPLEGRRKTSAGKGLQPGSKTGGQEPKSPRTVSTPSQTPPPFSFCFHTDFPFHLFARHVVQATRLSWMDFCACGLISFLLPPLFSSRMGHPVPFPFTAHPAHSGPPGTQGSTLGNLRSCQWWDSSGKESARKGTCLQGASCLCSEKASRRL